MEAVISMYIQRLAQTLYKEENIKTLTKKTTVERNNNEGQFVRAALYVVSYKRCIAKSVLNKGRTGQISHS